MAGWVKKIGHDTIWAKWDRKNTQKSNWLGEWKRLKCKNLTNDTTQNGLSELNEQKTQKCNWLGEFSKTFTKDQGLGLESVGGLNKQIAYPLLNVLKIVAI